VKVDLDRDDWSRVLAVLDQANALALAMLGQPPRASALIERLREEVKHAMLDADRCGYCDGQHDASACPTMTAPVTVRTEPTEPIAASRRDCACGAADCSDPRPLRSNAGGNWTHAPEVRRRK
jgi:hypothetical protein